MLRPEAWLLLIATMRPLYVVMLLIAGCAHPITPVVPYSVWPRVAKLREQLDEPPPRWLQLCQDRRADYSGPGTGIGYRDQLCRDGWRAYYEKRANLQAQFDYFTGPDYVQPEPQLTVIDP